MPIVVRSKPFNNFLEFVDRSVTSDGQRLILGVTALASQPFIDLKNKEVDEETRWTSAMRTIAKIVVGTTVGVIVRRGAINWVKTSKMFWKTSSTPELAKMPTKEFWKNTPYGSKELHYANGVGTLIGTLVGLITNFVIDAPLTKIMTNQLNTKVKPTLMEKYAQDPAHKNKKNSEVKYETVV